VGSQLLSSRFLDIAQGDGPPVFALYISLLIFCECVIFWSRRGTCAARLPQPLYLQLREKSTCHAIPAKVAHIHARSITRADLLARLCRRRRRAVSKKAFSQHHGARELKLGAAAAKSFSFGRFCGLYIFACNRAPPSTVLFVSL
jgi:hypothetical protein